MLFNSVLIASFLLTATALAHSDGGHHQSRSDNHVDAASDRSFLLAGAGWYKPPGTFNFVSGTFNVPYVNSPANSGVSIYVGLDGINCGIGLSAGVEIAVDETNIASYRAFYSQNVLSSKTYFPSLEFSPNDDIEVIIELASSTGGIVMMKNLNTNQAVSAVPFYDMTFCGQDVQWIVEERDEGVPISDFGTVTFTDGVASGDVLHNLEGATIVKFPRDQTVASVSIHGDSITVAHA